MIHLPKDAFLTYKALIEKTITLQDVSVNCITRHDTAHVMWDIYINARIYSPVAQMARRISTTVAVPGSSR
jgi:hypothetical protein